MKCGVMMRLLSLLNSKHTIWALTLQTRQCFCGTVSLLCASILHTHTQTVKPSPAIISSQMRTHTHTHAELIVMHPGGRRGAQLSHCRLKTSESGDAQTPLHPPQSPSHPGRLTDWLADWHITAQTELTNSLQRSQHCCFSHQHGVRLNLCFLPLFVAKGSYQVCTAPECGCTVSNSEMRAGQQRTPARDTVAFCAPVCSALPAVPAVRYST